MGHGLLDGPAASDEASNNVCRERAEAAQSLHGLYECILGTWQHRDGKGTTPVTRWYSLAPLPDPELRSAS